MCIRDMREHLYYGKKIAIAGHGEALSHKQTTPVGNTVSYSDENVSFSLEAARLEMSSYGKGDIREQFLEIVPAAGSFTSDFLYDCFEIKNGRDELTTLPCSYGSEAEVSQLKLDVYKRQERGAGDEKCRTYDN